MKDYNEMQEIKEKLIDFAELEGTELGEYCVALCELHHYYYMMEKNILFENLEKEIIKQVKYFEDNFKVVKREETYTRKYIELEEIE